MEFLYCAVQHNICDSVVFFLISDLDVRSLWSLCLGFFFFFFFFFFG